MSSDDSYKRVPPKSLDMNAIKQEARKLKQKKGWNPDHFVTEDPLEKLRQLNQEVANKALYDDAQKESCPDCLEVRQKSQDDTALCEKHLAEAMGF